jgi:2-polyprenyl-6-methoxyphenol hydroxylase-like FAD-dependent oxidoreductase
MGRTVVVGAGVAGLGTALLLGRQGREVLVLERDPASVPAADDELWEWQRPGTAHARLGHVFFPGFRRLLEERAPDVLQAMWAAGAVPLDFAAELPGDRIPADADFVGIMARRCLVEGVLRRAVEAEDNVTVRAASNVAGLVATPGDPPTVTGVRTSAGEVIAATTTVFAGGRLAPISRWLAAIGAEEPNEQSTGCGSVTYTRYFRTRLRPGEDKTVVQDLTTIGDLGFVRYELWGADRGTFCLELEPPVSDRELRCLRHDEAHMAAGRLLPGARDWLDPDRSTPLGPVAALGQERNVHRRFVSDGRPIALGLHVIGDARCQTNSIYAWGCASALMQAAALCDVLIGHPFDPLAQALDLEERIGTELADRHAVATLRDAAAARKLRGEPQWDGSGGHLEAVQRDLLPAASEDAEIFRAVFRRGLQLAPVRSIGPDSPLFERARSLPPSEEAEAATPGPTREQLLEAANIRASS